MVLMTKPQTRPDQLADGEAPDGVEHDREPLVPLEEAQLGIAHQILHVPEVGAIVAAVEEPADVRVPEAALQR